MATIDATVNKSVIIPSEPALNEIIRESSTPSQTIRAISQSSTMISTGTGSSSSGGGDVDWTNIVSTYFKFTSVPPLSSGNIFQWYNDSDFLLGLTFDGILQFKEQTSLPASLTGGLLFYNNNLYLGQS